MFQRCVETTLDSWYLDVSLEVRIKGDRINGLVITYLLSWGNNWGEITH